MLQTNLTNCVRLDITIWSGRAKLTRDDLKDPGAVPDEAVASLGSKKLINPDLLKVFGKLKMRARRACESHGTSFLGGYLINALAVDKLDNELKDLRAEYYNALSNLIADYDKNCNEWLHKNAKWAHILRGRMPSSSELMSRFSFDWAFYKMAKLDDASEGTNNFVAAQGKLRTGVVEDISQMLKDSLKSFADESRTEFTDKTFNNIDKAINKCNELSFIHPEVGVLCEFLTKLKDFGRNISIDVFRTLLRAATSPDTLNNIITLSKANTELKDIAWAVAPSSQPVQQAKQDIIDTVASDTEPEPESVPEPLVLDPVYVDSPLDTAEPVQEEPKPEPEPVREEPKPEPVQKPQLKPLPDTEVSEFIGNLDCDLI